MLKLGLTRVGNYSTGIDGKKLISDLIQNNQYTVYIDHPGYNAVV